MCSPLTLDEYKEIWAYIGHTEEQQNKICQWYYAIVAASIAYIFIRIYNLCYHLQISLALYL